MYIVQGDAGVTPNMVETLTKEMRLEGWRECNTSTPPSLTEEELKYQFYKPIYEYDEDADCFNQSWELVVDNNGIESVINELKEELVKTDYIIVKTYEARLIGEDDPYDSDFLHNVAKERKHYREEIRELLSLLPAEIQRRMAVQV